MKDSTQPQDAARILPDIVESMPATGRNRVASTDVSAPALPHSPWRILPPVTRRQSSVLHSSVGWLEPRESPR